jgi:diaminopimelate epimerase
MEQTKKVRVNIHSQNAKKRSPARDADNKVVNEPLNILHTTFHITCASMGNPHCIIFVDDVENFPVEKYGPLIENHDLFPRRTNVEFVQVLSRSEVRQRTWERGAGETLACGTGASAVTVAAVLNGLTEKKIVNHLSGGDLEMEWAEDGSVYMTGPAVEVFTGEIEV